MSDIERLLTAASDDTDQPLHHSVDDIVRRGRRSVRRRRIATAGTVALTTAAIIGGITTWSATRPETIGPAGMPTGVTSVDVETGKVIAPAPPVSPLSDREIIAGCITLDRLPTWDPKPWNRPGTLTQQWSVAVKTGDARNLAAVLISPDRRLGAHCTWYDAPAGPNRSYGRFPVTVAPRGGIVFRSGTADGLRVPGDVRRVLVDIPDEKLVRQALIGADGFYTLGAPKGRSSITPGRTAKKPRILGFTTDGRKVLDRELPFAVNLPPAPER
ncbi:hypothetical protein [Kribbella sp. CA-247076]|uniref:hypothetical protein n=1 Tax=Kribbella sp. CA-247076 TaxID=3239941 RepID=UPI003D8EFB6D